MITETTIQIAERPQTLEHIGMIADIVSAYVSNNSVPQHELPGLIASVHAAITGLAKGRTAPDVVRDLVAPVSVKKSITDDFLISMEDGKTYKMLRRHLSTHGLTPDEYRKKWNLPGDYPMVAPNYSATRSALAKKIGLGVKVNEPKPVELAAKEPGKRGRPRKDAA